MRQIAAHYAGVRVDNYAVMPNHVHLLIFLEGGKQLPAVSRLVQQWRGWVSKQAGRSIWQRSFYDHIVRNDQDYQEIWQYIENNPQKWLEGCYFSK